MDKCALTIGGAVIGRHWGAVGQNNSSPFEFARAMTSTTVMGTVLVFVVDRKRMTSYEAMSYVTTGFGCGLLLTNLCDYLGNVIHNYLDSNIRLSDRINARLDNIERNTRPPPTYLST